MNRPITDRITNAFVWTAAFCAATGVFLSITLLFRSLPPTAPVAVGLVTIQQYSKLRDYLFAALFFLLIPPLTVWFEAMLARATAKLPGFADRALFTVPWFLSPLFYLTTGKAGWILLLPLAISSGATRALRFVRERRWIRELFTPEEGAWHAMLFAASTGWLFFRYLVTGRRIAHIPTLFLEVVFVFAFAALFWGVTIFASRLAELAFGVPTKDAFHRIAFASLPIALLPFLAAARVPLESPRLAVAVALLISAVLAWTIRRPPAARTVWSFAAFVLLPAQLYLFSYASTAELSQWVDLFHRGESIGPASDYLRGKVPYRDVFALHGMLEDGLLDAWLMQLFGRSLEVAVARSVILGAFLLPTIWYLGLALFGSIPLALLSVAAGSWTTAENNRTLFQVAAVALFWVALRRRSRLAAVASGALAAVALFFSYEIGLYTIAGAFAVCILLWISTRRTAWGGMSPAAAAGWFTAGVLLGAAPFVAWLAAKGALDDFARTSFVTIPAIVDAVWSLPFPDLVSTFRKDLNLHTLAEFVLFEKFHLIVSPLTIAVALAYAIARWRSRRMDVLDHALLVLTVFAAIAQRTALGRAEFRHQYFAAFLIGPLLVLLGVLLVRNLREIWRDGSAGTRAFLGAACVAAVPLLAVLFWIPDLVNARLQDFIRYTARVQKTERDARGEEVGWRIKDVSEALRELTPRGEPIFDFSNQPALYFFAGRPNPTRFYQVPILSPRELQGEAIRDLERAKPPVILRKSPEQFDRFDGVTNELRAQALAAYIDDVYRYRKTVRGIELWTRSAEAKPRPVADYLAPLRMPKPAELVSGSVERMVFPAVGSLPGVNGSYWQSDLTLHNPFRDPIALTLRFVAGEGGTERRITLAPRQTLRSPDLVARLFDARGRIGTLWISHPQDKAPAAVVKTSDVAHGARASIEPPLTARDAATASTGIAELAVVGIPPAPPEGRRVNVGAVNIGAIPATFRVSARTRGGQEVGRAVEVGVPEDQVWIVNNVENAIGVQLDETMTLRISVIAGTGVGFASVVSNDGDSEFIAAIPAEQQQ